MVGVFVGAGEGDALGKGDISAAENLDLDTCHVKLDTAVGVGIVGLVGFVESDKLRAEEVVL